MPEKSTKDTKFTPFIPDTVVHLVKIPIPILEGTWDSETSDILVDIVRLNIILKQCGHD